MLTVYRYNWHRCSTAFSLRYHCHHRFLCCQRHYLHSRCLQGGRNPAKPTIPAASCHNNPWRRLLPALSRRQIPLHRFLPAHPLPWCIALIADHHDIGLNCNACFMSSSSLPCAVSISAEKDWVGGNYIHACVPMEPVDQNMAIRFYLQIPTCVVTRFNCLSVAQFSAIIAPMRRSPC